MQTTSSLLIGKPAPPVVGRNLTGGVPSAAACRRGRWVLLNFFASWCPPCRTESPELGQFAYSRPSGQQVAALVLPPRRHGGERGRLRAASRRHLGLVADPGEKIAISYGVDDPPQSFLIAPDGRVVDRILGGVTVGGLDRLVESAVAHK